MTTTEKYLVAALAGSVILNIVFWWKPRPEESACFVTPGYEVPVKTGRAEAAGYMNEYKLSLVDPDSTLGGVITRAAFDEMMCLENCNAISFMLAKDSTGTSGPGGKGTFIIFCGAQVIFDHETRVIREVNNIGSDYYLTHNWCPPSCLPL